MKRLEGMKRLAGANLHSACDRTGLAEEHSSFEPAHDMGFLQPVLKADAGAVQPGPPSATVVALESFWRDPDADLDELPVRSPRQQVRVLIVEDDEDDVTIIFELLSRAPELWFEAEWCRDTETALTRLASEQFDACIVDFGLPGRSGLDFVEIVRRRGLDVPVVLISGYADDGTQVEAIESGVADYLDKEELDVGRLERCLRFAIARKRHVQREQALVSNFFDPVTGTATATLLDDRLAMAIANAGRQDRLVAVFTVKLDGWQSLSEKRCSVSRDALLLAFAERLRQSVRATDTVARLPDDRFVIVAIGLREAADARGIAERLATAVGRDIEDGLSLTCSIGCALYPFDGEDRPALLARSEAAQREHSHARGDGYPTPSRPVIEAPPARDATTPDREQLQHLLAHGGLRLMARLLPRRDGRVERLQLIPCHVGPEGGPAIPLARLADEGAPELLARWLVDHTCRLMMSAERRAHGSLRLELFLPALDDERRGRLQEELVRRAGYIGLDLDRLGMRFFTPGLTTSDLLSVEGALRQLN